jgi:hypothetical protein
VRDDVLTPTHTHTNSPFAASCAALRPPQVLGIVNEEVKQAKALKARMEEEGQTRHKVPLEAQHNNGRCYSETVVSLAQRWVCVRVC